MSTASTVLAASNTGEAVGFWILAPIAVLAALGMILAKNAVHCALFLAAVQIIVYTGAILMLFLFVVMLVGVDTSDSLVETIKGQRLAAIVVGVLTTVIDAIAVGVPLVRVQAQRQLDGVRQPVSISVGPLRDRRPSCRRRTRTCHCR